MFLLFMCYSWFVVVANADFANDCLKAHNDYRKKHHVPDLILDKNLNTGAQTWADQMLYSGVFKHSSHVRRPNIGENLYISFGKPISAKGAVDVWYNEIKYYSFEKPKFDSKSGHFTQVIWKDSKKLGCAYSENGSKIYVVARYSPQGNVYGEFEKNVLPSESGSAIKSPMHFHTSLFLSFIFYEI